MKRKSKVIKTVVGSKTMVEGNIASVESIRIDGTVKGSVKVEGLLVLSKSAKVQGDIVADDLMVGGVIFGDIQVKNKVEAFEKAQVYGDISARSLLIDENVIFQGKCNMNQDLHGKGKGKMEEIMGSIDDLKKEEDPDSEEPANKEN